MSSIKRSNSSSNIPRLSRIPGAVRPSNTNRRSRSSSARPSTAINTNLLFVSGGIGRSSSYSNLATPTTTRLQPNTPSSTTSSASKSFRMNDKEWQRTQLMRVKNFFFDHDPEMPPLKPLSTRVYVHTMNILFKLLDSRIAITLENYKESVPEYLKSFKYKYNIKPSVMKTPTVPSSWQYILQIWMWLIDRVELFQNPERVLLPHTTDESKLTSFYTLLNYMADSFLAYNNSGVDQDKVDMNLIEALAQIHKINLNDDTLSQTEKNLDYKLKSLSEAEQSTILTIEEISKQLQGIKESNAIRIQRMYDERNDLISKTKEYSIKCKNIHSSLNECIEKKQRLGYVLSMQTCTKSELKLLNDEIDKVRNIERQNQQCLQDQEEMLDDYTYKINQQKREIQAKVHKTNNKLAVLTCKANELKGLQMPKGNVNCPSFEKEINDFSDQLKRAELHFKTKLEDWKIILQKKHQDEVMNKLMEEEITAKMNQLLATRQERTQLYNKRKEDVYDQIRKVQMEIIKKESELEEILAQMPDVNAIKKESEASLNRCINLKHHQQETMVQTGRFFLFLHNKLKDTVNEYMNMMNNRNSVIETYLHSLDKIL